MEPNRLPAASNTVTDPEGESAATTGEDEMTGFNTHIGTMDTAARRVDDVNLEIDRLLGRDDFGTE